jgi:Flp pilus assembly pilin Flp
VAERRCFATVGRGSGSLEESTVFNSAASFLKRDEGEDIIEYGVLAAFVSIVAVATVRTIGPLLLPFYTVIVAALTP